MTFVPEDKGDRGEWLILGMLPLSFDRVFLAQIKGLCEPEVLRLVRALRSRTLGR
jgi:hypothetical protein